MNFSTKAIHIGQTPDPATGSIIPPIYMTSTYAQSAPGEHLGYDYTRAGNPNFTNLEQTLAALEQARFATVFSSGLGAITAIISTLQSGDLVVASHDMYGGTYRLFVKVFEKFGIRLLQVNTGDPAQVEKALAEKPKMIFIESPTNPLLAITDIAEVAGQAHLHGTTVVVDNTFATPYFQQPITLGADIVIHSTTKYIGGHSDVIGGAVMTNSEKLKEDMDFLRKAMGLNPSPFDVWLTSRGVKTLGVRMKQHEHNALAVADFLQKHESVKQVYYPGLPSHPNYNVAQKQMNGFSGIVSVEFDFDLETMKKLISSFELFTLAESLGGIESLVDHPASMTHASIPREERLKAGLPDGLVRFSVGIEDTEDLIADLEQTLKWFTILKVEGKKEAVVLANT